MDRFEAIYARQSADKRDSISIETQTDYCKKRLTSANFRIFSDKGFSGKSTKRPQFQEMMNEVKNGNVSRIIIYKFDRISRSLMDFLTMQQEFTSYNVKLISCCEDFDTNTQIGKMILNILMMFAEMERENIQKRVKDNYYARGEKGFYLGGSAPFGYGKAEIMMGAVRTYKFIENKKESGALINIFNSYLGGNSMGEIARYLNSNGIWSKRQKAWTETAVARVLKNPVYVKANADVYAYLKELGATMTNSASDYQGRLGCLVYGTPEERVGAKFSNLKNYFVSLGLHQGIIDAETWLSVQDMIRKKANHSNLGEGSLSWLQGLVKCRCGHNLYIKRYKKGDREYRYFYCPGRKNNSCSYHKTMPKAEDIEGVAEAEIFKRALELKAEKIRSTARDTPRINELKIKLIDTENKIKNLVEAVQNGSEITASYLNRQIEGLDKKKCEISRKISEIELKASKTEDLNVNTDLVLSGWKDFADHTKKEIAKELILNIIVDGKNADFIFN